MIDFRGLNRDDLRLLYQWFKEPTINRLYALGATWSLEDIEHKYLPRLTGHDTIPSFIIYLNNKPIGFIQYYCLSEHYPEGIKDDSSLFACYSAEQMVGIDLFIASAEYRGQGLGVVVIKQFINQFLADYACVVVDPHKDNQRAIRCYEQSGFVLTEYSMDSEYCILINYLK